MIYKIINYCIVLTARTAAVSFFQNPALDGESIDRYICQLQLG